MKRIICTILTIIIALILSTSSYAQDEKLDVKTKNEVVASNVKYEIISQTDESKESVTQSNIAKIEKVSSLTLKEKIEIPYAGNGPIIMIIVFLITTTVIAFICYKMIKI